MEKDTTLGSYLSLRDMPMGLLISSSLFFCPLMAGVWWLGLLTWKVSEIDEFSP
jgi:hypothetical protein